MVLRRAWARARDTAHGFGQTAATAAFWGRTLATAAGVSVLAGTGQVGVAYGFGLLRPGDPSRDAAWSIHLTWIVWFAALATLAGAAAGAVTARRAARPLTFAGRIATVVCAAVGAVVVLPLAAWPARTVTLNGRDAALEAGIVAGLGVVVGLLAALAALSLREVAIGLTTVVTVGWTLALISVVPALDLATASPPVRLAVLDLPHLPDGGRLAVGILFPLLVALSPAAVMAARSRGVGGDTRGGDSAADRLAPRAMVAVPAAGALIALSYLIGGPGPGLEDTVQVAPYAASLATLGAAVLAVLLILLLRSPLRDRLATLRLPRPSVPLPRLRFDRRAGDEATAPARETPGDAEAEEAAAIPTARAPSSSDAEYVNWVKELAADDDSEEWGNERRRLRPGSSDTWKDMDLDPPPLRTDRDEQS